MVRLLIGGHPHSPIVLPRIWHLSPELFISGLVLMYSEDPTSISRILDIAQELKALALILESRSFAFAIELAAIACRREYLNLEKWLREGIREHGDIFFRASLDFLNEKINNQSRSDGPASVPLPLDISRIFLRTLHETSPYLSI